MRASRSAIVLRVETVELGALGQGVDRSGAARGAIARSGVGGLASACARSAGRLQDHSSRRLLGKGHRGRQNAFRRASRTLRQVGWFEVLETRGHVEDGKVAHYQVTLKVGFTLDDD
jgi:flavin-binding protein dodecin